MNAGRLRSELRALIALATPIMIAQLAGTAMGFADTLMAGQVGAKDLAAVALGNSLWLPVFLLMNGTLLATTLSVARYFGKNHSERIGPLVRQAAWLGIVIGSLCTALLWNAQPILHLMQIEDSLSALTIAYLRALACGFPAMALYQVLRCLSDGLGHSRPGMVTGICGLLLNIPLNYCLIHGKLGLPAMGAVGCGWATAWAMLFMLGGMLFWVRYADYYRPCRLFQRFDWPSWPHLGRLLSIGLPIGVAILAEVSVFSVIALLVAGLGEAPVAGHQVTLSVTSVVFMIPLSLGMAVTVRVGQALGRQAPGDALFIAKVGMGTALCYAGVSASCIALLSERIASLYTSDPQIIAVASGLLLLAALFQFSDGLQITAAGALRGYQDTRMIMLLTLIAYWGIGLPIGAILGLTDWFGPASGPYGLWQGLIVGLSCAALLLGMRLSHRARREILLRNEPQDNAAINPAPLRS
ncbi:MATE family efflux transporter [Azomonas macrocytogenes]|uniref:Multidrug-efflux transporter n=1 Tax=Azomonas macrocytogenes TaxID=69962 RepID=A0A839T3R0_AZOMA|nr:MATE family efflux transporter [Azomonas macrocytogenes]MBB3103639.1 MATE family multidrug resistance protein [Azomonas macrocytogenes]